MNQTKRRQLYYLLAAILLFCFSGTFLLMPVANSISQGNATRIPLVIVGLLFWLTGIGGYTLLFLAHREGRRMGGKDGRAKRKGIFPVNRVAVALDFVFAVGVVILIAWSGKLFMQRYGAYVVLFVMTMALHTRLLIGSWTDRERESSKEDMKDNRGEKKGTGKEDAGHG